MKQNNRVVNGQCQLENHCHRVRDKGNLPQQKIGSHVQQSRGAEGEQEDGNLCKGVGGQPQDQNNDDHAHSKDHLHFLVQGFCLGISNGAVNGGIIRRQPLLDLLHSGQTDGIGLLSVKGNGEEGVRAFEIFCNLFWGVLLCPVAKGDGGYAVNGRKFGCQVRCHIVGHVGQHDPGCAVGDEFIFHNGKPLAGFGVFRQVLCQVIADLDPSLGEQREDQGAEVEEKDEISSVHDGSGQFFEEGWFVGLLVHGATSCPFGWGKKTCGVISSWNTVSELRLRAIFCTICSSLLPAYDGKKDVARHRFHHVVKFLTNLLNLLE